MLTVRAVKAFLEDYSDDLGVVFRSNEGSQDDRHPEQDIEVDGVTDGLWTDEDGDQLLCVKLLGWTS